MAKIVRKTQKIFGFTAGGTGITVYGSPASGTPSYSTDPANIQSAAWENGWAAAALAGTEIPTFQDFNAIHYVSTRQIAYLLQEGIAEYDSGTEYNQFSIVKKTGTYELYGSKTNLNTGNALPSATDNTNWQYLGNLSTLALGGVRVGNIVMHGSSTVPSGFLECNGAAVSRTTYAALFAEIGTTWGAGNGTTTFNVPDWRGEFPRGWDNGRGIDPGRVFGSAQGDLLGSHSHTYNTSYANGTSTTYPAVINQGAGVDYVFSTLSSGGAETRPRNVTSLFCIKF